MHVIRLRAAWEIDGGRAVRRFHQPSGLSPETRVWLAWDGPASEAILNGEAIDALHICGPPRFDVTQALQPANVLELGTDNGAVLATVRLEIEELSEG